jgi:hypothetical protein
VYEVRTFDRHRITVALQYYRLYCQVVRIAGVQGHVRGLEGPSRGLYGFVKSRSTVSNLIEYSSFVLKLLEKDCHVDSIYTDFSKAFDRERNCLLLDKMSMMILSLPLSVDAFLLFWWNPAHKNIWETMFRKIIWLLRVFHRTDI